MKYVIGSRRWVLTWLEIDYHFTQTGSAKKDRTDGREILARRFVIVPGLTLAL